MNETTKKILLIAVVVIAVIAAVVEGIGFVRGPQLESVGEAGHAAPGQGMKAKEKELQNKGRKAMSDQNSTTPPKMGNAAGDVPPPPGN